MSKRSGHIFKYAAAGAIGGGIVTTAVFVIIAEMLITASFSVVIDVVTKGNSRYTHIKDGEYLDMITDFFLPLIKYVPLGCAVVGATSGVINGTVIGIGASLVNYEVNPFLAGLLYPLAISEDSTLNKVAINKFNEIKQVGREHLYNCLFSATSITDSIVPQVDLAGSDIDSNITDIA